MKGVALITGGQQGIGLGAALALKAAGFRIAIASLPPRDAPEVQAAMAALDGHYVQHDLADVAGVEALVVGVEAALGPITCLVANAGVPARVRGDLLEMTPQNFDFTLGVNLRGNFFLGQAVARRMLKRQGAYQSMIFVTSVSAEMASVERGEYCISKAGASMAVKLFALRLAAHGVGVFELRPGIIATPMTAGVKDKYDAAMAGGLVPAGRWGQPEDIGRIVVPMATGAMGFATGAVVPVDGGLSIPRL
jgi:NAD(P)-dependent dehydrogenase (short-subunit alcohol dehydrogenase family)